ncbi:DUF4405 domain-containing protein [Rhizobium sp. RU36D]|uniref:DUF4405 domain-containing protein n=1 Tax=Rhizobium sp. RU36D TaxID=1907415 RepID=UPI0009D86EFF|nr:DUF4405 domain-containing protein [Rhizobium sp. RU36D]SMC96969.1 hypothetical protein SAMN05880593_112128 [Rhizobium sp. RU36D]
MPALLARYATPLTTGLFVVSLVSGIALFFHWGGAAFHGMHEWLSMVLILPFVLHIWKNWRPFLNYFRRLPMAIALGVSLVASLAFAWPSITGTASSTGGNPQFAVINRVMASTPAKVAPIYDQTTESLVALLKEKGFAAAEADKPLAEIATASGKQTMDLAVSLASIRKP